MQQAYKLEHLFRRIARSPQPTVCVPADALAAALDKAQVQLDRRKLVRNAGGFILPRSVVTSILEALHVVDMHEAIEADNCTSFKRLYEGAGPAPIWRRLKQLSPKGVGSLTYLIDEQGNVVTSLCELEQEARSTRPLWTVPPEPIEDTVFDFVRSYAQHMPALEHLALPDRTTFEAVIHNSGDGAPGINGIPYAVSARASSCGPAIARLPLRPLQLCIGHRPAGGHAGLDSEG